MKKDIQMGSLVEVSFIGADRAAYFYRGTAVGFTQLKDLHTGELSEKYLVAVRCSHCGVVESLPEHVVEPVSPKGSKASDRDTDARLNSVGG